MKRYNKKIKRKKFKEGTSSHSESILQLATQVKKYIQKHESNLNAVINDLSIGFFLGISEAFAEDGDPNTNGSEIASRIIKQLTVLVKNYEGLLPEEDKEFNLEDEEDAIDGMQSTLDSDIDDEEDESEDDDDSIEDDKDSEDLELEDDEDVI